MKLNRERIINTSETDDYSGIGIYAIVNCSNGRMYIGSSNNVRKRVREHDISFFHGDCNKRILEDIKKGYKFRSEILYKFESPCRENILREKEKELIMKNNAYEIGYNISYTTGRYFSQERVF